ncbi:hypothetical protein H6G35_26235 [Aulosira sp. FACHB-113]|uniref:hypothetical protein n=1 Tax=Tolypothrix tenuis TaxID=457083 RepID=UPI000BBBDE8B|nr:hypothetical protein [Aulosira sp. FACHB-113]
MVNPQTDQEWTIHSINIHGVFFEHWCEDLFRSVPDLKVVSTNYPVEFPPPNGHLRGKESALDIRVELRDGSKIVTFIVECKKNNPDFVDWVFFPKRGEMAQRQFVVRAIDNLTKQESNLGWDVNTHLLKLPINSVTLFSEARETRGDYQSWKSGQKTKTSNAAVTDAAYQVALATQAIWMEETQHSQKQATYNPIPQLNYETQIIVPCIVTTAQLYSCSFDPKNVNSGTGEISLDKAILQPVPFVIYEYSLPKHLQSAPLDLVQVISSNNLEVFVRMDIIVINSSYLKDLLTGHIPIPNILSALFK